ncbi:GGDEF domain-containing protein [Capsulimonas corticalis]|uniref:GGDEF domain-containing protein n=1 Tax=Capsulimonas corticalis TaxID=2219043 RepID=A0A402D1M5_9BACT|nr:GGDEF domain-containing protein [Capsulimonas corticalis]BDI28623.1 GGDEF domain-containing protein [Capsulimonas corticalis]
MRINKLWTSLASIALVSVTGGVRSPLVFLLFLPILIVTMRSRARFGFFVGLLIAALYLTAAYFQLPRGFGPMSAGIALSFPAVAAFVALLHRKFEDRYLSLSSRTREMKTLLDMSQMMDSAFDLDMTLNLILLNVQEITRCQVCAVYLKGDGGDILELRAASSPSDRLPLISSIRLADARADQWALDDNAAPGATAPAFYAPQASRVSDEPAPPLYTLDQRVRSFACVPLTCIEGLLGMLYVGYDLPQGLDEEGLRRLEQLVARASFPLQRALLQQGFQFLAFRDAKTGLDNYRQFEQNLVSEMNRAERYNHRLSVILLDIDHFKNFNDTYGHPAGDALLAQLAVVLQNCLRGADRPARYGGEEFVVLCPETGKEEARLIAERIRKSVSETRFTLVQDHETKGGAAPDAQPTVHVTVSLGFATFPQDARSSIDIVKRADLALYAAKNAGRNTVRGHEDISSRIAVG